jgi:CHASE2 domain-containing sensor protein
MKTRLLQLDLMRRQPVPAVLLTVVVGIVLVSLPPLGSLSYDSSYLARSPITITNVVLVCADEDTLREFNDGHDELTRSAHTQLLDRLKEAGAPLVFYDFVFAHANEEDELLVRAITNHGSVILVASAETSGETKGNRESVVPPPTQFRNATKAWGHAELMGNVNEPVRKAYGDLAGKDSAAWVAAAAVQPRTFTNRNPNLTRWLNYYGWPDFCSFPHISFQDLLTTNGPTKAGTLSNQFVFVGQRISTHKMGTANDSFATPMSRFGAAPVPGVVIHATAFLNLILDDWLRQLPLTWQWLTAVIWGGFVMLVLFSISRRSKWSLILASLACACGLCAVSLYVQWHFFWWWSWFGPVFGQTATALFCAWRFPRPDPYIAFISYRIDEDGASALLIRNDLSDRGYKTFIDVTSMNLGRFDEQLLREIDKATFFVLILSPGSLVRCAEPDDWVLRELSHALATQKMIIPIFKGGFEFDSKEGIPDLPQIIELRRYQGIKYDHSNFPGFMQKLIGLIKKS